MPLYRHPATNDSPRKTNRGGVGLLFACAGLGLALSAWSIKPVAQPDFLSRTTSEIVPASAQATGPESIPVGASPGGKPLDSAYTDSKYAKHLAGAGHRIYVDSKGNRIGPPPSAKSDPTSAGVKTRSQMKFTTTMLPSGARLIQPESPVMAFTYATVGTDGKVSLDCRKGITPEGRLVKPGEKVDCLVPGCALPNCQHNRPPVPENADWQKESAR